MEDDAAVSRLPQTRSLCFLFRAQGMALVLPLIILSSPRDKTSLRLPSHASSLLQSRDSVFSPPYIHWRLYYWTSVVMLWVQPASLHIPLPSAGYDYFRQMILFLAQFSWVLFQRHPFVWEALLVLITTKVTPPSLPLMLLNFHSILDTIVSSLGAILHQFFIFSILTMEQVL